MFHKLNNEEDLQKRNTAFFNSEFNIFFKKFPINQET